MTVLTDEQIAELMPQVANWSVIREEGMNRLNREFSFKNFTEALDFTNRIAEIAEEADHHPRLVTEWGRVTVTWWSHYHGGMVVADIEMAKKVDSL